MSFFSRKEQIIVIFLIGLVLVISLLNFLNKDFSNEKEPENTEIENILTEIEEGEEERNEFKEPEVIMIHISGEVNQPGIITLSQGDRVIDAVNLAGGLKKEADLDRINLAKKLVDEEKIYIPKIGEENIPIEVADRVNSSQDPSKININTCTKEELISLPGIGDVTAGKILDYREENLFKTIEDIMNVSGIGEKKFEGIKDLIIVQ